MEGSQGHASVGDALQETEVLVPKPGDPDFDPTAPQPGDPEFDEWVASQATPIRPSERIDAAEQEGRPIREEELYQGPVLHYAVEPGLAVALLNYLGQMPHDEVRHMVDGLKASRAIRAETAGSSGLEEVDREDERR